MSVAQRKQDRREHLFRLVCERPGLTIADLAAKTGVHDVTVLRDLRALGDRVRSEPSPGRTQTGLWFPSHRPPPSDTQVTITERIAQLEHEMGEVLHAERAAWERTRSLSMRAGELTREIELLKAVSDG